MKCIKCGVDKVELNKDIARLGSMCHILFDVMKDKDAIKVALQQLDDRDRFMIQFTMLLLIPNISADIKERVHRMIRTGSGITNAELDKIQKLVETELDKFIEFFKLAYGRD